MIRLRPAAGEDAPTVDDPNVTDSEGASGARRGFDYAAFEARLESLWFQRKALLADGRDEDAARQSELIRSFCIEEGIHRLPGLAGALVAESDRWLSQGRYDRALRSLDLAETFDPGRAQIHRARAAVLWSSGRDRLAAAREMLAALTSALGGAVRNLSLVNRLALVFVVALVLAVVLFSILMLVRYQVPFRHEIEEWMVQIADDRLARSAGWAAVVLPMLVWVGTGWAALYWIVITFRFMRRSERLAAVALLVAIAVAVPGYRLAVSVYGLTSDPVVRTTLASAGGEYEPDRVLELQQLVQSHPKDPVYHFLLAGLYKNGRYFEEAFAEYKAALELDPAMEEALINVGNIFHATGQYPEALANYRKALDVNPRSILAWVDMHLAQSESFRFKEAEESLDQARALDSGRTAELLSQAGARSDRPVVLDAALELGSVWQAALGGGDPGRLIAAGAGDGFSWLRRQFVNPVTILSASGLLVCLALAVLGRKSDPARRCIRCGRPFCRFCKSGREGHEYCSQCLHLYVLGDGLAPETKTRKLYEVERHERLHRYGRRLVSAILPGSAHLLRGKPGVGVVLILGWLASLIAWQPAILLPLEKVTGVGLLIDALGTHGVPAAFNPDALAVLALAGVFLIWIAGNLWRWRGREA